MDQLFTPLLIALLGLCSFSPCLAGDVRGRVPPTPTTPSRLPKEGVGKSAGLRDPAQLKQTLTQIQGSQEPQAPPPVAQPQGERLTLTLQESIAMALKYNLDIGIAALTAEAVQTETSRAKALFHPSVGVALTVSGESVPSETTPEKTTREKERNTQEAKAFLSAAVPTGGSVLLRHDLIRDETHPADTPRQFASDLTLSIVQPLLRGGRIYVATKPIKDAEFDFRIEEARLMAEILRVMAAAKRAYYTVLLSEKVIAVLDAALQRDRALIETSEALFRAGFVTKRDVFSAEISHAKDLAKLASAQADLASAQNAFADVLGLPIGKEVFLVEKSVSFQPIPLEVEKWAAAAMVNRPEILELDVTLDKSLLNIRTAHNTLLPQVDLTASYGRSRTTSRFERSLDPRGQRWSAGVAFSIPIGNVAARSALARTEIEHARLQQELVRRKRQIELEVRAAAIKLQRSVRRMEALQVVVENAKGKLEVARARFALGQATNLDITDAQDNLVDAETDLQKALIDHNIGLAELEASIGGPLEAVR